MSASDLTVQAIGKSYETATGTLEILNEINLQMNRGEALAITGPSGSGKSTLLYILGTLEPATSGTVTLNQKELGTLASTELAAFRNQEVGFVFQDHHLLPQCTVLENVLIPTMVDSGATEEKQQLAKKLLDRVGLSERTDHRPAQLSGGERQRVAVCRALINQPTLLLADEPTGNLDQQTAESIGSLLLEIAREQNTILICVTHSETLAGRFPRRAELQEGRLPEMESGSSQQNSEVTSGEQTT